MMKGKGEYIEVSVPDLKCFKECAIIKRDYKRYLEPNLENISGIYMFFLGNKAMYIGMSVNLSKRIFHHMNDFQYDKIYYLVVKSENEAAILEAIYIKIFKPKHNGTLNGEWIKYGSKKTKL